VTPERESATLDNRLHLILFLSNHEPHKRMGCGAGAKIATWDYGDMVSAFRDAIRYAAT